MESEPLLFNRARSDPSRPTTKYSTLTVHNTDEKDTESLISNKHKYQSLGDISDQKQYNDGFGKFNIRKMSVEVLDEEEIFVPARNDLIKVPFYTTPLSVEATVNAFYDYKERLNEMGFQQQAEAALVQTKCESVENAVTFILNNYDAIYHRFKGDLLALGSINENAYELCVRCNKPFNQHLIDHNGSKIEIGLNDDNYNELLLDIDNDIIGSSDELKIEIHPKIREIIKNTESEWEQKSLSYDDNIKIEQCLICFDQKPVSYYANTDCGHNNYCTECLTEYYTVKTKDGDVLKVKCIDPNCDREIKEDEILSYLTDEETKSKFRKFKQQKLLMLNENARFCPAADCEGYMIGSRLKPKLKCPECQTTICFNCSKLWHGYFTKCSSAKNAQEDINDAKYYQWELNKDIKKCPKCKMRIEKNAGCNHMTCVHCRYEFCWLCKGKYSRSHFKEWNIFGCPGGQYNDRIFSITKCPSCFPMWFRRLLICILLVILSPLIIVGAIVIGVLYCFAFCVMCTCQNVCGCCK
eukprot:196850_1